MSIPRTSILNPDNTQKNYHINMNFYEQKIQQIKIALGMDVKMAESVLEDGVTKVVAESFEAGSKLYVVSESGEKAPAPEGIHTLEDGTKVTVDSEGTISEAIKPEPKVEVEIEAAAEEVPAGEEPAGQPTKSESEIVKEEMKNMIMQCMQAIEEVAKEVAVVKEEMASYKSKMEKMSKTPGASKLSTFNDEPSTPLTNVEARLEGLKAIKAELSKTKRKF
jgi:hypothetical protein